MSNTIHTTAGGTITREFLISVFERNGWQDAEVLCPDGTPVTVCPCGYGDITKLEDCDYFLVEGDLPWMGDDSIDKIVDELNRHAELVAESDEAKAQLQAFYDEHERLGWDEDSYSEYSDWYKSWYGYRPRFDWAEHNTHLAEWQTNCQFTEEQLVAFVNCADSWEKCETAEKFIRKLPLGRNVHARLYQMICERYAEYAEPDSYDYYEDRGSYSPSAPWNAPGMKMSDFIRGVSCF